LKTAHAAAIAAALSLTFSLPSRATTETLGLAGTNALCSDNTSFKHCQATDFSEESIKANPKWAISSDSKHSASNVWIQYDALVMRVVGGRQASGGLPLGAEIVSTKQDFLYGSYRAMMRTAIEAGTVNAFFYYRNNSSEIDVEVLSSDSLRRLINFTIHPNQLGESTHREYPAAFNPSLGFHEYRFDWTNEGTSFFLDGSFVHRLTGNTPKAPGRIIVNHWTLGSPGWGSGPPLKDALMYVKYIVAYFD
jgi:beta-glucanase (GH16 family)